MDADTLKQYLADDPPTVARLEIKPHFEALSDKEKKVRIRPVFATTLCS